MRFLLAAAPLYGHLGPLAAVGTELCRRGHHVTVLTGDAYEQSIRRAGMQFRRLPAEACGNVTSGRPHRARVLAGRDEILETFVRPLPSQHEALTAALEDESDWAAVVSDTAFLGALPLVLARPRAERLPVFGLSVTPLSLASVDCAPFGSALQPGRSAPSRLRNRQIYWLLRHGPMRALGDELDAAFAQCGAPSERLDYFDLAGRFDATFHLGAEEFEYPRREMPASIRFVGPLGPDLADVPLPSWWGDLDGRRVVHVTQGTLANQDLQCLVGPTVRALADEPVLTVVATGRPLDAVRRAAGGSLPANVRVADYLPYRMLLPRVDAVVTNGGYGGVQQCLRHAVPTVVAGATEDKPEVAARVRRAGVGIDLRSGRPSSTRIRHAVRRVLEDPAYRRSATRLSRSIHALGDPRATIADALERSSLPLRSSGDVTHR